MSKRIAERVTIIHEKHLIGEFCHLYQLDSFDRVHLAFQHSLKPPFAPLLPLPVHLSRFWLPLWVYELTYLEPPLLPWQTILELLFYHVCYDSTLGGFFLYVLEQNNNKRYLLEIIILVLNSSASFGTAWIDRFFVLIIFCWRW